MVADEKPDASKEALSKLSLYLPGAQNERANEVYRIVAKAFACQNAEIERLNGQGAHLERDVDQWVKNSALAQRRVEALERQLAETREALQAARKPEDYWRQVAEATELTKKGLEQDIAILKQERDDLVRDLEKQNRDIDEHQARWQGAERHVAEMRRALNRIARGAELRARVMRDPLRTGGWEGAEKAADAFDDIAKHARDALPYRKDPPG